MGLRFNRRIKLLPGVTLNVSKSGLSTTIGRRGAKVTIGHGKTRTTVGIPGTGLSYTAVERHRQSPAASHAESAPPTVAGSEAARLSAGDLLLLGLTLLPWVVWLTDRSAWPAMAIYVGFAIACGVVARRRGRRATPWMLLATYLTPIIGFAVLLVRPKLNLAPPADPSV